MQQTILLVEDSPDDVFFMKRALKLAGVSNPLHVAEDGQQAVDYLSGAGRYASREEFPLPTLVLLDLRLPFIPGFEVLKQIRRQPELQCVPVIVLTSSREDRDMQRAYALGANSFLVKGADSSELVAMVKTLTTYWLHYNQVPSVVCSELVD